MSKKNFVIFLSSITLGLSLITLQNSFGQSLDNQYRNTGGIIPTADQEAQFRKTHARITNVKLNTLGLSRVNMEKSRQNLPLLDQIQAVPMGQEIESAIDNGSATPTAFISPISATTSTGTTVTLPSSVDNSQEVWFPPIGNQGSDLDCQSWAIVYYQLTYMNAMSKGWTVSNGDPTKIFSPGWVYGMVNGGFNQGAWEDQDYSVLQTNGSETISQFPAGTILSWDYTHPNYWIQALSARTNPVQYVNGGSDAGVPAWITQMQTLLNDGYILTFQNYIHDWQYTTVTSTDHSGEAVAYAQNAAPCNTLDVDMCEEEPGCNLNTAGTACTGTATYSAGHVMTIVGYDNNITLNVQGHQTKGAFKIANQWSTSYQNHGFVWLAYDALYATTQISGATFPAAKYDSNGWPTAGRTPAIWGYEAFELSVKQNYSPKIVAEFTVNTAQRDLMAMSLSTNTKNFIPNAIYYDGGDHSFNDGSSAVNGTFVLDFTDIMPSPNTSQKYSVNMTSASDVCSGGPITIPACSNNSTQTACTKESGCTWQPGVASTLSSYQLIDLTTNTTVAATGLPVSLGTTGGTKTSTVVYTYTGHVPPVANATATPLSGIWPLTVNFNAAGSSATSGSSIKSYYWDFGDGNTETDLTPTTSHTYSKAGLFPAVLTVTDNYENGASTSYVLPSAISVSNPPYVNVTASAGANGSISPAGNLTPAYGSSQTFTITANSGYSVYQILVDNTAVKTETTYTPSTTYAMNSITANHTISVSFVPVISIQHGTGVSILCGTSTCPSYLFFTLGSSETFTFTPASGDTVTQVFVDGASVTPVPASYTLSNMQIPHTIAAYSNSATGAPQITAQPASKTVTAPATATFTVTATGTATLAYQWQKNGVNISAAKSATYTTPATTSSNNGDSYAVLVTNSKGSVISNAATLNITGAATAPVITTQPISTSVSAGSSATLNVVASGNALSYQWNLNGNAVSGANNPSYSTPTTLTAGTYTYTVTVTNSTGSVTSNAATLTVTAFYPNPIANATATPTSGPAGLNVSFNGTTSTPSTGASITSYLWNFGDGDSGTGSTVVHTYNYYYSPGVNSYTVTLTVTDSTGKTGSYTLPTPITITPAAGMASITTQPASQTTPLGQTATFNVVATGNATLHYQWQKNGVNISGATSSTYTTPATVSGDNGSTFDVIVNNSLGVATSNPATLTVSAAVAAPVITTQPASTSVTAGSSTTLSVTTATSTASLSYQWNLSGNAIAGATSSTYATPTTLAAGSYSYTVTVTNAGGSVTSNIATLTVNPLPAVVTLTGSLVYNTSMPGMGLLYNLNTTVTDTAGLGSSPQILIQFVFNNGTKSAWVPQAYATTVQVLVTDTTAASVNAQFKDGSGNLSNTISLNVVYPAVAPSITTQPSSTNVTSGTSATLSVTASGTAPLTYQWDLNGNAVAGATSSTYATPTTLSAGTYNYTVTVSNSAGSVTSNIATLTVTASVPTNVTINGSIMSPGNPPTLVPANACVVASSSPGSNLNPTGNTFHMYNLAAGTYNVSWNCEGHMASYSVTITSQQELYPITINATVILDVTPPTAPTNLTASAITANSVTLTWGAATDDVGVVDYYIFRNNAAYVDTKSTNLTWTDTNVVTGTTYTYKVLALDAAGNGANFSNIVTVNVTAPTAPSITTQPANAAILVGSSATLSVIASGTAPLTYQWNINGNAIAGATSSSYTTPTTLLAGTYTYTVTVSNSLGSVTSNQAMVTVQEAPIITVQPISQTLVSSGTVNLTVSAIANPAPTFQWQESTDGGNTFNNYGSPSTGSALITSTSQYFIGVTTANNGNEFRCVVTNSVAPQGVISNVAVITVNAAATAPVITSQPVSTSINTGSSATLSVTASGTAPLSYQWDLNGNAISGANSSTYATPTTLTAGTYSYTVTVTNSAGSVTSNAAILTIYTAVTAPVITAQPASTSVTAGSSATLSVTATGTALTYQWSLNGNAVAGATSSTYATPTTLAAGTYSYTVIVTNTAGSVTSNTATLTVTAAVTISPDGSVLNAPSTGNLVTSLGTWTFGATPNSNGDYPVLLKGSSAGGGSGVLMLVYNQGKLYLKNHAGSWYLWSASAWTAIGLDPRTPISADGTVLNAGTTGNLATSAGIWTFGTTVNSSGNYPVLLNGNQAAGGTAVLMLVYNNGQLYVESHAGGWYLWNGSGWSTLGIDPRTTMSANGTVLNGGTSGSLVTSAGTWTFGPTANGSGDYPILLNGSSAGGGVADLMLVYNNGQIYVENHAGSWYLWNGSSWNGISGDPR